MIIASVLILLLPLVFLQIFLYRLGSAKQASDRYNLWQGCFLIAAALWGGQLVVITEGLSLFSAINRAWLALAWSFVLIVVLLINKRTGRIKLGWIRIKEGFHLKTRLEIGLFMAMGAIAATLFLVAVVSPSNNIDALMYHIPRALHWAQNQSLQHYPAARISQNIRPYFAEAIILHLRILFGSDRPVNLVQWFSMIASVIGATGITSLLGGKRTMQWLTAAFVISIPMGVLQSTTAQNDYVSAFWVICLTYFVVLSRKRELSRGEFVGLALTLGLGMLTKGTFIPFAAPFMAWYLIARLIDIGFKKAAAEGMVIAFIAITLNVPFYTRNIISYGGPYGNEIPVRILPSQEQEQGCVEPTIPAEQSAGKGSAEVVTIGYESKVEPQIFDGHQSGFLSRIIGAIEEWLTKVAHMIAMNFVTPVYWINQKYFKLLGLLPSVFTSTFIDSLRIIAWNQENMAGSPLHMLLILIAVIYGVARGIKGKEKILPEYSVAAFLGFAFVGFIGHATWIWSIRYQLAFFVMGAPLVGHVFKRLNRKNVTLFATIGFLIYALPYVFISNLRPVISLTPWPTRIGSVFQTDPSEILFAMSYEFRDEYEYVAHVIKEAGCTKVGLWLHPEVQEYGFWWLLQAPQSGIQLRYVTAPPELERYLDSDFQPCAIICSVCEGKSLLQGVPLAGDYGHIQLFLEPEP